MIHSLRLNNLRRVHCESGDATPGWSLRRTPSATPKTAISPLGQATDSSRTHRKSVATRPNLLTVLGTDVRHRLLVRSADNFSRCE